MDSVSTSFDKSLSVRHLSACTDAIQAHSFQYFGSLGTKEQWLPGPRHDPKAIERALARLHPRFHAGHKRRLREVSRRGRSYHWDQHQLEQKLKVWLRNLCRINQGPVSYVYAVERGDLFQRPHVHFQLGGVAQLSIECLDDQWTALGGGRAEIAVFDPVQDTGYTYKKVADSFSARWFAGDDVLWDTNIFRRDRRHNSKEQAALFAKLRNM
jgi:hypothetical protein